MGETRPPWARPIFWLGGIVVAALGVAITNALVPRFSESIQALTETGESVRVLDVSSLRIGYWLAFSSTFNGEQIAELNNAGWKEQEAWLVDRGGVDIGTVEVRLTVSTTREKGVRIVDIKPRAQCAAPLSGSLFVSPPAGADMMTHLIYDLDAGDSVAMNAEGTPYFSKTTMSLKKGEEQVFVIEAKTKKAHCTFDLEISALDDGKVTKQLVKGRDGSFQVTAPLSSRRDWQQAFLGGVACEGRFVAVPPLWGDGTSPHLDDVRVCDNRGQPLVK